MITTVEIITIIMLVKINVRINHKQSQHPYKSKKRNALSTILEIYRRLCAHVPYLHCQLTAESKVPSKMACMGCMSNIKALSSSST